MGATCRYFFPLLFICNGLWTLCLAFQLIGDPQDIFYSLKKGERKGYFCCLDWGDPSSQASVALHLAAPDFDLFESLWRFSPDIETARQMVDLYAKLNDDESKRRLIPAESFLTHDIWREAFRSRAVSYFPSRIQNLTGLPKSKDEVIYNFIKAVEERPELVGDQVSAKVLSAESPRLALLFRNSYDSWEELTDLRNQSGSLLLIKIIYVYTHTGYLQLPRIRDFLLSIEGTHPGADSLWKVFTRQSQNVPEFYRFWDHAMIEIHKLDARERAFWLSMLISGVLTFINDSLSLASDVLKSQVYSGIKELFTELPHEAVPRFLLEGIADEMNSSKYKWLRRRLTSLFTITPVNLRAIPLPWLSAGEELMLWKRTIRPATYFMGSFEENFLCSHQIDSHQLVGMFTGFKNGITDYILYHPNLLHPWTVFFGANRKVTCTTLVCMLDVIEEALHSETMMLNPCNIINTPYFICCGDNKKIFMASRGYARLFLMRLLLVDQLGYGQVRPVGQKLLAALSLRVTESYDTAIANGYLKDASLWAYVSRSKLEAAINEFGLMFSPREISASALCTFLCAALLSAFIGVVVYANN